MMSVVVVVEASCDILRPVQDRTVVSCCSCSYYAAMAIPGHIGGQVYSSFAVRCTVPAPLVQVEHSLANAIDNYYDLWNCVVVNAVSYTYDATIVPYKSIPPQFVMGIEQ